MVVRISENLELRVQKNRNIEKFAFKGVQMNSFAIYY